MADYRVKIRKLLALAEFNSNENEAKAALLKAKELMAEHKLTEEELADIGKREVKVVRTGYVYTVRGEWWMGMLSCIIGENYCCQSANVKYRKGAQKREVEFIGLEGDIDLCVTVFKYAVDSARKLAKAYAPKDHHARASYAYGFTDGIRRAFEEQKQQKEEGWGLVMVIPKEVKDYCAGFSEGKSFRKAVNNDAMSAGYTEGKRFNPTRRLR